MVYQHTPLNGDETDEQILAMIYRRTLRTSNKSEYIESWLEGNRWPLILISIQHDYKITYTLNIYGNRSPHPQIRFFLYDLLIYIFSQIITDEVVSQMYAPPVIWNQSFPYEIFTELDEQTSSMVARLLVVRFGQKKFKKYVTTAQTPDGCNQSIVDYCKSNIHNMSGVMYPVDPISPVPILHFETTKDFSGAAMAFVLNEHFDEAELDDTDLRTFAFHLYTNPGYSVTVDQLVEKGLTVQHAIDAALCIPTTTYLGINVLSELL